ncbi:MULTISPECIES: nitrate reductase molybdenum cofactor assembly chaperone [unclassified Niallia]|uniref:nitrate reductase molybdenum cofactor assembly chaperone n=1 Tax=unclassified Niallia TaxID=2837522 RepID=UPI00203EEF6E|nr:nitrate reductase molybdenum cofactor assembly chaperone [Niallia sp. MER 6]MCM3030979.1 nitrate reductase molybdenum cofactor assembly chaperone [Niallia sp. MER 6]
MINQREFEKYRPILQEFSLMLLYPQERRLKQQDFPLIELYSESNKQISENMNRFFDYISELTLLQQQEYYVQTFDFSKKTPLHMTYVKYEDAKERGQILVQLKLMYAMCGLELDSKELSDYLPLMLEFLANGEWIHNNRLQKWQLIFAIVEDGTYFLQEELKQKDNPYQYVIQAVRLSLKACMESEMEANIQ